MGQNIKGGHGTVPPAQRTVCKRNVKVWNKISEVSEPGVGFC